MSKQCSKSSADRAIRTILSVLFVLALLIGLPAGNVSAERANAPLAAITYQQFAMLTATDSGAGAHFGATLAIEGSIAVVGVPDAQISGKGTTGAVYIFNRDQDGTDKWGFVQKLVASNGISGDQFGYSVAISGNTIIVGARGVNQDTNMKMVGAAYVFQRTGDAANTWTETQILKVKIPHKNDLFGTAVAIHNNIVFVGSPMEDPNDQNSGAAYVFVRETSTAPFAQQGDPLVPSDRAKAVGDRYGSALALDGETLVVGAPMMKIGSNQGQGMTYVYSYWKDAQGKYQFTVQDPPLSIPTGQGSDNFGKSVAISNNIIAIGAPSTASNGNGGAAYLYKRNAAGVWEQIKKETATPTQQGNLFGTSVALDGDLLAVGAPNDDVNGKSNAGQIYLFARNQNGTDTWGQVGPISVIDQTLAADDAFGTITGISGSTVLGGVPGKDLTNIDQGVVYVMRATFPIEIDLNGPGNSSIDYYTTFKEGDAPVNVTDPTATISSLASSVLDRMVIRITNLRDGAYESLSATGSGAIAQSNIQYTQVDTQTGQLTIDPPGTAPLSDFFAVMRTIKYANTSENPDLLQRVVRFWAVSENTETMQEPASYITIVPVNDPPSIHVKPAALVTPISTPLNLGDMLSITDVDSGIYYLKVDISVDNGTLTLGNTVAPKFLTGDGVADASISFNATVADANKALLNMVYTPTNTPGNATLNIAVDDMGNTGGGSLTDSATLAITIYDPAINNPPTSVSPTAANVREDATVGTTVVPAFTATDPDVNDTLTFALVNRPGCSQNAPFALSGTALVTTAVLDYETVPGYIVCIEVTDHAGIPFLQPVAVSVDNVNEAPANHLPGGQTTDEDTPLTLTSLSVSDVDAGESDMVVSLSAAHGQLALADAGTLSVTGGSTFAMTITGGQSAINTAFSKGLIYTPAANYNGADTLTITTNDQGATGLGNGPLSATDTLSITINPIKDATQVVILGTTPDMPRINEDFLVNFQVTSGAGIPTGMVTVTTNVNGKNLTCQGALDASGKGSCSIKITEMGSFPFNAEYSGDAEFLASSSNPFLFEVTPFRALFCLIYR